MIRYSRIVEDSITKENGKIFDIIRYCISDKVPSSILEVLHQKSPAEYALNLSKSHGTKIFDLFEKDLLSKNKYISKDIKDGWVFDKIMEAGCHLRIAQVRTIKVSDAVSLVRAIIPYSLIIETHNTHVGRYTGLIDFKENIKTSFEGISIRRHTDSMGVMDRFVETVGSIHTENWILFDSLWKEVLTKKESGFFILRAFLHAAILAHTITDAMCEELLEVSRETVLKDVEEFILLKEAETTTQKDIFRFLNQVEYYITDIPSNILAYVTFTRDFTHFKEVHHKTFGDRFISYSERDLPEELDRPEWKFLRDLDSSCSPEVVLGSTFSPLSHTEYILSNYYKEIYESPFIDLIRQNLIPISNSFSVNDKLTKAILKDKVYQSLILRRFLDCKNDDSDLALHYVKNKSYILLVIEDKDYNLRGLSVVSECLNFHLTTMKETFFEREYLIIKELLKTWEDLKFFKPNRMNKNWKNLFSKYENRYKLRQFFFKVFEALYLEKDEEFQFHFDTTRYEFFTCLDTFNFLLTQSDYPEDIISFMDSIPSMKESITITKWDQMFWVAEYDQINF